MEITKTGKDTSKAFNKEKEYSSLKESLEKQK
jgi:hypothetical protein